MQVGAELGDVAAFLDAYWVRCVKPAGLRSLGSVRSQITILKEHLGHLPLAAIEDPDEINRFKSESDYAEDVEVASIHRVSSSGSTSRVATATDPVAAARRRLL